MDAAPHLVLLIEFGFHALSLFGEYSEPVWIVENGHLDVSTSMARLGQMRDLRASTTTSVAYSAARTSKSNVTYRNLPWHHARQSVSAALATCEPLVQEVQGDRTEVG